MKNLKHKNQQQMLIQVVTIITIAVVAVVLIVLFKIKGGLLGIILGVGALGLLVYWVREGKKVFTETKKPSAQNDAEWFYDLIDNGENLLFAANVPGPATEVKAKISRKMLHIRGGKNFEKSIHVPKAIEIQNERYSNGILYLKLKRKK